MNRILLFFITSITLSGCLLLSDPSDQKKETLTDKAQNTIIEFNSKMFKSTYSYETYFFSKLNQHKPEEIRELETLFDEKDNLPSKRRELGRTGYDNKMTELDSLIDVKKYEIKRNKIFSDYSMEHIFVLQKAKKDNVVEEKIVEAQYFMNHTLDSVKNVKVLMNVEVPQALNGTFNTFFFEDPLHRSDDYNADRDSDESFYYFYKERLAQFDDVEKKSDFLLHTLYITLLTKKNKKYIPEQFGLLIANQLVRDSYTDSYKETLRTSQMMGVYDMEDNTELLGYELFLEASFTEGDQKRCFYINYNPWLEIVKFEQIAPPYEEYLN